MGDHYGLGTRLNSTNLKPMERRIKNFFLPHTTVMVRIVFLIGALAIAIVPMLVTLNRDLANGFIDTLNTSSTTTLWHYLLAQWVWLLLHGLHLVWTAVTIALWFANFVNKVEVNADFITGKTNLNYFMILIWNSRAHILDREC